MKLFFKTVLIFILGGLCCLPVYSADLVKPKREMRTVWLATVFGLDWPAEYSQTNIYQRSNVITETGNTAQINKQKQLMITMLDSLAKNNINCVNFQVRGMCDAMYNSAYEPWSSYLVAKRGMDPGYDPLQFVIDECHKRGMECHAWLNPYRYESSLGAWGSGEGEYRHDHPDWLMDFNGQSRLNPGKPEVIQRIVDVCKDIITKYDVDGILYDDYFYIDDTTKDKESFALDKDLYDKYVEEGGTLSQGDWRRENVNIMIKRVYDMIQEVKPWVRFGVSPAGVAASDVAVASKYGVTPCPGSDWQYDQIWSDPLAWVSSQTLDYISPQVYWTIGHTTDYSRVTPWWTTVANKFKRHMFVSHDVTSLTIKSTSGLESAAGSDGLSVVERNIGSRIKASGPNNNTFEEFANQIRLNRECSLDDSPGSFFYSTKYMYWIAPLFGHYLKNTVFTRPAIIPAMTYKPGYIPGNVKNLALSGDRLTWEGYDNVRYTVYAVPASVAQSEFNCEVDYLLGTSYATAYDIPEGYGSGYQFAVCVLDRYGNEYSPVFAGAEVKKLPAPVLTAPADGTEAEDPFDFVWNAVAGANKYIIEIAYDAEFKDMFRTLQVTEPRLSSAYIEALKSDVRLYWRVRSTAVNSDDGVSAAFSVIPKVLSISSPAPNSVVSVTPVIEWNAKEGNESYLEIATDVNFNSVIHSAELTTGSYTVPPYTLKSSTQYYARVTVNNSGVLKTSPFVAFTTEFVDAHIPVVTFPVEGGKFYSEDMITLERQPGVHLFTIEVSASSDFPRAKYTESLKDFKYRSIKGGDIKISGKNFVEGETYYLRVNASYVNEEGVTSKTGTCDVISFEYGGYGSGIDSNLSGTEVKVKGTVEPVLSISAPASANVEVRVFNTVGVPEGMLYDGEINGFIEIPLTYLSKGMHIIAVNINGSVKVVKVIK